MRQALAYLNRSPGGALWRSTSVLACARLECAQARTLVLRYDSDYTIPHLRNHQDVTIGRLDFQPVHQPGAGQSRRRPLAKFEKIVPVLKVLNMQRSVDFYTGVLGFMAA